MRSCVKIWAALGWLAIFAGSAAAQDLSASELAKLSKPQILETARQNVSQNLVVEVEASSIDRDLKTKRSTIKGKQERREAASNPVDAISLNNDISFNNDSLVADYKAKLAAQKSAVFTPLEGLGVKVVRDYPHSSTSLVTVPDLKALEAILKSTLVIKVGADEVVKISANWPGSYQDVAVMGAANSVLSQ